MTAKLAPFTASQKRSVLAAARKAGKLSWDKLDRLLLDAARSKTLLSSLVRSLGGVRFVDPEGGDDLLGPTLTLGPAVAGHSDADLFAAYADQVRTLPRFAREQEYRMAKRLEFARLRLEVPLRRLKLPEETLEALLRGANCAMLDEALTRVKPGRLVSMPCLQVGSPVQLACADFNRLRGHFVERNLYLVIGMSHAYRTYGIPMMDLIQEGNASLIRAVEKYDWRKDVRFGTYAAFWVRQAVERMITANRGIVRVPNYVQQKLRRLRREGKLPRDHRDVDLRDVSQQFDTSAQAAARLMETDRAWFSLDAPLSDQETSLSALLAADEEERGISAAELGALSRRLGEVMEDALTPQEREIVALRFGLGGRDPQTLDQIGERLAVSRERVRQMQVKALDKLGKPRLLGELEDFL